jgi:glycosyltransferase involved in cell wall biosynthesis
MRVEIVDPSAFTPPYDHALCAALARAGADVSLVTSRFVYGEVAAPVGYTVDERFYRRAVGAPASRLRRATKLLSHAPDMLSYRRASSRADVVHFQWLAMQWIDGRLLPTASPVVLTAHDLLPREPRPGQANAQRRLYERVDAVVAHSEYGRRQLVERLGLPGWKVSVIHHGAFTHLTELPVHPLAAELAATEVPVGLFLGLLRPYKGVETLLDAWRGIDDAELWIVGRPRGVDVDGLRARAGPRVRFVSRFVADNELAALFRRADIVALPYLGTERLDFSGVLATALAFGRPIVASDIGGFAEVGALRLVAPGDADALRAALTELIGNPEAREQLAAAALAAANGPYSWDAAAAKTLAMYQRLTTQ